MIEKCINVPYSITAINIYYYNATIFLSTNIYYVISKSKYSRYYLT